jgi:membrane protein implicated in regulation of membrane protease activity
MAESTLWWIAAGLLVAAELLTGTFYLLMLAIGGVAGALAAHAGLGLTGQLAAAAWSAAQCGADGSYRVRRRRPGDPGHAPTADVNLDVGEAGADRRTGAPTARPSVRYRGAPWTAVRAPARHAPADPAAPS